MSYQVLARKWRPKNFHELVGQDHVRKALVSALDNDRLHHAYLFTGTRGVGKTTIARIISKCLNCETGITSRPCGECTSCREIDEGRFVDLIEVDAASRTKVEDTRELLDNVQYAPSRGRFKVYLIDEVHMLSTHSFNALLKTLEEPPPHVKFLLATTDPQKLPVTVLSRCLQFNLKNMPPERVVEHLSNVLTQEQIPFDDAALWQLGRAADGSMRDALSLTDQAIAYGQGQISASQVSEMLGLVDQRHVAQLIDHLINQDAAAMLGEAARLSEQAADFETILADMALYLHRMAVAQLLPDAVDNAQGDREQVINHAACISAEDLQLYYQIAIKSQEDLPLAPDMRTGFEMAMIRMLAFAPQGVPIAANTANTGGGSSPGAALSARLADGKKKAVLNQPSAPVNSAPAQPVAQSTPHSIQQPEPVQHTAPTANVGSSETGAGKSTEGPGLRMANFPGMTASLEVATPAEKPVAAEAPAPVEAPASIEVPAPTETLAPTEAPVIAPAASPAETVPKATETQTPNLTAMQPPMDIPPWEDLPVAPEAAEQTSEPAPVITQREAPQDTAPGYDQLAVLDQIPAPEYPDMGQIPAPEYQQMMPEPMPEPATQEPVIQESAQHAQITPPVQLEQNSDSGITPLVGPCPTQLEDNNDWLGVFPHLALNGLERTLAQNSALTRKEGDTLHFNTQLVRQEFLTQERINSWQQAITQLFNQPVRIEIEQTRTHIETPAMREEQLKALRKHQAQQIFMQDDHIQRLISEMGAEVDMESVEPLV
ncbi:DNA polymerase III subunit gamma/tau [Oceanospirillum beijerinckii]|uniref:DNA polymerase III subunit gamma/tau n=1 Tax=Oceanospirillum beijerinckii TaxID=64976 RepID=UPI00041B5F27|nr:DNA polymerase III subunit gamma/tau [Oceanospirillum beijerinckii]